MEDKRGDLTICANDRMHGLECASLIELVAAKVCSESIAQIVRNPVEEACIVNRRQSLEILLCCWRQPVVHLLA